MGHVKESLLSEAQRYHNAGDLSAAEKLYKKILKKRPQHPEALHLLGLVKNQRGDNRAALKLMLQSVNIKADEPFYYNNLGLVQCALHLYEEAEISYRQALKLNTQLPSVLANLATLSLKKGNTESAVDYCRQALTVQPDFEAVNILLGEALRENQQHQESLDCYKQVLSKNTSSPDAYIGRGNTLMKLSQYSTAAEAFRQALKIQSKAAQAHYGLATCSAFIGDGAQAVGSYRAAIRLEPSNLVLLQSYVTLLKNITVTIWNEELERDMVQLLNAESIAHQDLVSCATSLLICNDDIKALLERSQKKLRPVSQKLSDYKNDVKILSQPLSLLLLTRTLLTCPELEHMLTAVRKVLLLCIHTGNALVDDSMTTLNFLCALAQQCRVNDYAYYVSDDEHSQIERLTLSIKEELNTHDHPPVLKLALLATYKPLISCFGSDELAISKLSFVSNEFESLITKHITEPEMERDILEQIPSLTEICEGTSTAVREQYEESPYPRWEKVAFTPKEPLGGYINQSLSSRKIDTGANQYAPDILIAGCGTGHHALMVARRVSNSNVLAIDLSRRSLAYAIRKARDLNDNNVDFFQADILALGDIEQKFDLVECAGVLHHLHEPLDGWRILIGLLKPGGFMRIALYSEIARREVVRVRSMIKEEGYGSSHDEIRRFRHDLYQMPESETMRQAIKRFRDFYNTAECRDLFFHVQEHRYTTLQLEDAMQTLNLEFLGFEMPELDTLGKYRKQFPDDHEAINLKNWHDFELMNPNTFRSMYTFWVKKQE